MYYIKIIEKYKLCNILKKCNGYKNKLNGKQLFINTVQGKLKMPVQAKLRIAT